MIPIMRVSAAYLLHFHELIAPGKHSCQHYLGSAEDLDARLWQHRYRPDARLLQVAKERGIGFDLVRVWPASPGDVRKLERQLKQRKARPGDTRWLCPICASERKRNEWQLPLLTGQAWGSLDFSLNDPYRTSIDELAF